jgi:hypothetical protein
MGALAVRATASSKFFCQCVNVDGKEVFIAIRAASIPEATAKVHENYGGVEYVMEVFTEAEMDYKKRHLRRSVMGTVSNI